MARVFSTNDLFALFPELPRFQHRPLAEQVRAVEDIEQVQERARESVPGIGPPPRGSRDRGRRGGAAD